MQLQHHNGSALVLFLIGDEVPMGETLNSVGTPWPCSCSNAHQALSWCCALASSNSTVGVAGCAGKGWGENSRTGRTNLDGPEPTRPQSKEDGYKTHHGMMHPTLRGEHHAHPPQAQGGLNIKYTKSAQAWLPVGLGSSPLSHPQRGEEQRAH